MQVKILSYVLAVVFLLSGGAKLAGLDFELAAFERWGYPLWFMYFTGLAEVAGGFALAANLLRKFAAPALAALMIGAVVTHVIHSEWPMFIIALVIFSSSVVLTMKLWKPTV
jgi:uncharacterized membrane protein YphA (DoxX/SURF4 family)